MENDTVRTIEAQGPGSILEEIARQGAQRMLAQAMEAEVRSSWHSTRSAATTTGTNSRYVTDTCRSAI